MFTGLIEAIGTVKAIDKEGEGRKLILTLELPNNDIKIGDSIAVNGVCLTVTSRLKETVWADIGRETLAVTTLKDLSIGDRVNIERPLSVGDRFGGHLVQGHVDCVGKIIKINKLQEGMEVFIEAPKELLKYVVKKGSVAVNGVSLTAADCTGSDFKVFLIPHTVETTTFKYVKTGDLLNLEVDIIGKYVEKLFSGGAKETSEPSKITEEFLRGHGF
ncbi:MAG: riboflavin synthase [Deltaproteobacteria bacterium]|nr:riboflavin synthase [Deltaproteobacteria bacterium]MBI2342303.1 riboflavin synthase [Deltaproteobacteria bacterium]